jgi:hypothetical protein
MAPPLPTNRANSATLGKDPAPLFVPFAAEWRVRILAPAVLRLAATKG